MCRRKHESEAQSQGEGGRRRDVFLSPPHTAQGEGGQQGEEVTVKQARAASATTLQQCGLPQEQCLAGGVAAAPGLQHAGLVAVPWGKVSAVLSC